MTLAEEEEEWDELREGYLLLVLLAKEILTADKPLRVLLRGARWARFLFEVVLPDAILRVGIQRLGAGFRLISFL